jgi:hypothetical protein
MVKRGEACCKNAGFGGVEVGDFQADMIEWQAFCKPGFAAAIWRWRINGNVVRLRTDMNGISTIARRPLPALVPAIYVNEMLRRNAVVSDSYVDVFEFCGLHDVIPFLHGSGAFQMLACLGQMGIEMPIASLRLAFASVLCNLNLS